ncbi:FERM domain-containing protein 1, partial [Bos mutus]
VQATGHELLQQVCDQTGIREAHFFGLSVVRNNEHVFMDLEQKLSKYFSKDWKRETRGGRGRPGAPFVAFLGVQYYVENGRLIRQVGGGRAALCHGASHASGVRSGLGPGCPAPCGAGSEQRKGAHPGAWAAANPSAGRSLGPAHPDAYVLRHAPALHREQRGLSPREAELRFIREACRLEDVPVHFFRLYKDKKEDRPTVVLGLTLRGLQVFQGKRFELWPHGQPAARRLVYHTGCAWRSRHLLRLLRTSHQLHLGLQQARQQLQLLEEAEGGCHPR